MHTANLRKVGGSTMLAVPVAYLEQLHIKVGSAVNMEIDNGRLIIEPKKKQRRYTLDELMANYTPVEMNDEDRIWLDSSPVGNELI
ncbi:MAG: antitoxin [Methylobacter sp.]|nr:antitoxin [Methylobacter sp.]